MSADIIALLDHLNLTSPIPSIGHDWGATLLSRLEYYNPSRLSRLAYLTIAPTPFGASFDLDKINAMTKQLLGYEGFGYQKFFMDDLDGASKMLEANHDRMDMLMFAEDSTHFWKEYFARTGGLERWLTGSEKARKFNAVSAELSKKRKETFAPDTRRTNEVDNLDPGYRGPLMWYVALNTDINLEDERNERTDWETYKIDKDVLLVLSNKDPISLTDMQTSMVEGYVGSRGQLMVENLTSGHFVMLEKANELATILAQFFAEN